MLIFTSCNDISGNAILGNGLSISTASINIDFDCNSASTPAATVVPAPKTTHLIRVGMEGQFLFNPSQVQAKPGDVVTFQFRRLNHTVTESSLQSPCQKTPGGFDSGFGNFNLNDDEDKFVAFNVRDTDPRWFFCAQSNPFSHCSAGMVFGLNPGNLMNTFLDNAQQRLPLTPGYAGPYSRPPPTVPVVDGLGTGNSTSPDWSAANSTIVNSTVLNAQNVTLDWPTTNLTVSIIHQTSSWSSYLPDTITQSATTQPATTQLATTQPATAQSFTTQPTGSSILAANLTSTPSNTSLEVKTFTGGSSTWKEATVPGQTLAVYFIILSSVALMLA